MTPDRINRMLMIGRQSFNTSPLTPTLSPDGERVSDHECCLQIVRALSEGRMVVSPFAGFCRRRLARVTFDRVDPAEERDRREAARSVMVRQRNVKKGLPADLPAWVDEFREGDE